MISVIGLGSIFAGIQTVLDRATTYFGIRSAADKARWAAQTDWWISYASGTTTADGASSGTPITQAEYERRTEGLTPTVSGAVTVHYLDVPGGGQETIRTAFARIALGTYLQLDFTPIPFGFTGVVGAYTDHVTTYGASHIHQITVTGHSWTSAITAQARLRNTTVSGGARLGVAVGLEYDYTGGVVGVSMPYIPSDPLFSLFGPTSFIAGDTFVVETLPTIGSIDASRTIFEQSTADGVFGRLYVTNVRIGGSIPGTALNGTAVYANCSLGNGAPIGNAICIACQMLHPVTGQSNMQFYGCYTTSAGFCRFDECSNLFFQDGTGGWGFYATQGVQLTGELGSFPSQSVGLELLDGAIAVVGSGTNVYGTVVNFGLLLSYASHLFVSDVTSMIVKGTLQDAIVNQASADFPGFTWDTWRAGGARYSDSADGSSVTATSSAGGNAGVLTKPFFAVTTGDQTLTSTAGVLTDLRVAAVGGSPLLSTTVGPGFTIPSPGRLWIDFRARATVTTNPAVLAVLVNGTVVMTANLAAGASPTGREWQTAVAMTPGTTYQVKVQYAVPVGGTLQIRPVGTANGDEFASLAVWVTP